MFTMRTCSPEITAVRVIFSGENSTNLSGCRFTFSGSWR